MAAPGLSEIVTTTLRNRSGKLRDNMSRHNPLMTRLTSRGRKRTFDGGRTIVEELAYANNGSIGWYSGYQPISVAPQEMFTAAEFPIRQAAAAVSISGLEEAQNSGKERVFPLLAERINYTEKSFLNFLSLAQVGDGSLTNSINGLQNLVADSPSSGTVGGINRATSTSAFWRNISFDATTDGGAAATSANITQYMNTVYRQISRGRDTPDLIVADGAYWQLYLQSLQAIQRISTDSGAPDLGAAGFTSLKYMNADVVLEGGFQGFSTDPFDATYSGGSAVGGIPANHLYFLNTEYISWRPHSDRDMVPLSPDRFSTNQDAMVRLIGWYGNMTLSCAFLQAVLKD